MNRSIEFTEDFAVHKKGDVVVREQQLALEIVKLGYAKFVDAENTTKVEPQKTEAKTKTNKATKK